MDLNLANTNVCQDFYSGFSEQKHDNVGNIPCTQNQANPLPYILAPPVILIIPILVLGDVI